ncbi:MAG: DUF429 domain-containing protein [Fervidicoccaceae archaeon]
MTSIGIDLAASEKKPTYLCELRDGEALLWRALRDREIIIAVSSRRPRVVSIDAPLSVPALGEAFRAQELAAMKLGAKLLPLTLKSMRALALRGASLSREMKALGLEVVETHPTSAAMALGLSSTVELAEKLTGVKLTRGEADSLLCALVGELYIESSCKNYGGSPPFVLPDPSRGQRVFSRRIEVRRRAPRS